MNDFGLFWFGLPVYIVAVFALAAGLGRWLRYARELHTEQESIRAFDERRKRLEPLR